MSTRYYQLKKQRGKWTCIARSNSRAAIPERTGCVVVEADHRCSMSKIEELAESARAGRITGRNGVRNNG